MRAADPPAGSRAEEGTAASEGSSVRRPSQGQEAGKQEVALSAGSSPLPCHRCQLLTKVVPGVTGPSVATKYRGSTTGTGVSARFLHFNIQYLWNKFLIMG